MFVGNFMTMHGIKEDIGWKNEWGMAASSRDKDYVHKMISMINERTEDCVFCICQVRFMKNNAQRFDINFDINADKNI